MAKLSAEIVPVTPFQQNCTILFDEETKTGVVVDPGGDAPAIASAIEKKGLSIEAIWITHGHIDHAGGAMELKDLTGAKIVGPHEADRMLLDNLAEQAKMFGLGGQVRNCEPDRWLEEGDRLCVAGHEFDVLHTPGHAPGHVVFVNHAAKFVVMGDVLFSGSIGRTDLPGGDHQTLLASIRDKILPLGDDYSFLCGHGPGSRIGDERRSNPFLRGL
ncbi:MBL fold metallo-hydrolase [Fulvimarina endophytica]|uniref:MBL fold metallo-hydrolase n=1 Tax=Fulvimarina endophytica TaxID=2293836 RepID=A0A371X0C3_9HYPH|nr:MBL fold metallo-hydrolase [Fulvimarina endophytica]RFC62688.1 MBL fold metallo-hydrolase [Fulvimarina endophytica]